MEKLSRKETMHFARINFREWGYLTYFTGINFEKIWCLSVYKEDKTLSILIPLMITSSFIPKTWKISRNYCFSYFFREKKLPRISLCRISSGTNFRELARNLSAVSSFSRQHQVGKTKASKLNSFSTEFW